MVCLTTGTMIVMWLGEMITEFGLGNGISIIIMAGIIAELPTGIQAIRRPTPRWRWFHELRHLGLLVGFLLCGHHSHHLYTTLGQRRIPIRQNRRAGGAPVLLVHSTCPLKVNMSGVIPIIFAQAIIMFPSFMSSSIPQLE